MAMVDWNQILATHGATVWRTVYRLVGRHADALDCYQETFLAAYRSVELQPVAHWPTFLTCLATRRAIDGCVSSADPAGCSRHSTTCRSPSTKATPRSSTRNETSVSTRCGRCSPSCPRSRPRSSG